MIALYNPNTNNPFSVQYVYGAQVFRKEIIPGYMMGFRNLTGTSQIVNLQSLTGNNVTVYDLNAAAFVNQATGFINGFRGFNTASGMTVTSPVLAAATGFTFITTGATAGLANNSASAETLAGGVFTIGFSGAVTTFAWAQALRGLPAFAGAGWSINGDSLTALVGGASGGTSFTVSANTASMSPSYTLYAGDNKKREDVLLTAAYAISATTALSTLRSLVTGSTS